jgi:hypothetical protein
MKGTYNHAECMLSCLGTDTAGHEGFEECTGNIISTGDTMVREYIE